MTTILVNAILKLTRIIVILQMIIVNKQITPGVYSHRKEAAMPLHNRLKEYRARLDLNQSELGKLAGVSRQTISQIERGDYSPSVTLALRLAKICGVTVEDIFSLDETEDSHETK